MTPKSYEKASYEEAEFSNIDFKFESILWRQWYRCNEALTFGKNEIFNNAVKALEVTLIPYIDEEYNKELIQIRKEAEKQVEESDPRDKSRIKTIAENDKYFKIFRALAKLMSRSGVTPQREVISILE